MAVIPDMGFNNLVTLIGSSRDAEELWAYELGYRHLITEELSMDLALFYNDYDELSTREMGMPFLSGADVILPYYLSNLGEAETYGAELAVEWSPRDNLGFNAAYSYLETDFEVSSESTDTGAEEMKEGVDPEQHVHLRGHYDLGEDVEFNTALYWVDRLSASNVPSYLRGDVNVTWRPRPGFSLVLAGQNFFHDAKVEFGDTFFGPGTEVERAVLLSLCVER